MIRALSLPRGLRTRVRGEGHTEYILITGMIMICAVVGLVSFVSVVKAAFMNLGSICLECDTPVKNAEEGGAEGEGEEKPSGDETKSGLWGWLNDLWGGDDDEPATIGPDGKPGVKPLPWYRDPADIRYWLFRAAAVIGGGPHTWHMFFGWD